MSASPNLARAIQLLRLDSLDLQAHLELASECRRHGMQEYVVLREHGIPPSIDFLPIPGRSSLLARHCVTRAQWRAIVQIAKERGITTSLAPEPSTAPVRSECRDHDECPVDSVSWVDCVEWCWLYATVHGIQPAYVRAQGGLGWAWNRYRHLLAPRLPLEVEWNAAIPGSESVPLIAWRDCDNGVDSVYATPPSRLGFQQLLGAVWEHCHEAYSGSSEPLPPIEELPQQEAHESPFNHRSASALVARGSSTRATAAPPTAATSAPAIASASSECASQQKEVGAHESPFCERAVASVVVRGTVTLGALHVTACLPTTDISCEVTTSDSALQEERESPFKWRFALPSGRRGTIARAAAAPRLASALHPAYASVA